MNPLKATAARWREEAETLRAYGADALADTCERHAEELEAAFREYRQEALTIAEAARESGYTEQYLRDLVNAGKLPDSRPEGSQRQIHVRRCDLPRKPATDRFPARSPADDLYEHVIP